MSDRERMDDEARAAFVDANIDLAFRFLEELIDEPACVEQTPSGSTVYVVPPDAPAVLRGQTARALRAAQGVPIPGEAYGLLYVDRETDEVVVNVVPQFLGDVVRRDASLIDVLLHPETELRGLTLDEAKKIRDSLLHDDAAALTPLASFADLAARMERLEPLTA